VDDLYQTKPNDGMVVAASKRYCKYSILALVETIIAIIIVNVFFSIISTLCGIESYVVLGIITFALMIGGYIIGMLMAVHAFAKLRWWGSFVMVCVYIALPLIGCFIYGSLLF
jgi:hypothetical protein